MRKLALVLLAVASRWKKPLLFLLVILSISVGTVWLGIELLMGLARSIVPGIPSAYSTSVEPHTIVLRSGLVSYPREQGGPPRTKLPKLWRLRLQRAYITDETGSNSSTYDAREGYHSLFLQALLDDKSNSFRPLAGASEKREREERIIIFITNEPTSSRDNRIGNYCEKRETRKKDLNRCDNFCENMGNAEEIYRCRSNILCPVYMGFQGWSIEIGVPALKYDDHYQSYCEAVRGFLGTHTLSQDAAFVDGQIGKGIP